MAAISKSSPPGARRLKTADALFVGLSSLVVAGLWLSAAYSVWAMFHG